MMPHFLVFFLSKNELKPIENRQEVDKKTEREDRRTECTDAKQVDERREFQQSEIVREEKQQRKSGKEKENVLNLETGN